MSDRIAVMNAGNVEQIGTPTDIYHRPASVFVAGFIGQANLWPAEITSANGASASATTLGSQVTAAVHTDRVQPGPAVMMVRPERLALSVSQPASGSAVEGAVTDLTFQGPVVRVSLEGTGGHPIVAHLGPESHLPALRPGDRVWAAWDDAAACLLPDAELPAEDLEAAEAD